MQQEAIEVGEIQSLSVQCFTHQPTNFQIAQDAMTKYNIEKV
jgi:hypothetical protein